MSKINNNLISTFGILTFIFGLFITSPVYASVGSTMYTGVTYFPQNDVVYQNNTNNQGQISIVGCEGRNTGFSSISGQSCVGNYINNQNNYSNNTTPSNINTRTNTSSSTTTTDANTNNVSNATTTTTTENTTSAINENSEDTSTKENTFSGVTANALVGSNSFMPTGLLQWIILLIIIVAIMFLWRYVHAEEKYLAEPLKHA